MKLGNDVFLFYEVAKFILKFAYCKKNELFSLIQISEYKKTDLPQERPVLKKTISQ